MCVCVCVCATGHTGTLGELVGCHTKVVIYATYAVHYKRL